MQILRPAILLVISLIAPVAWTAHPAELRHASRELDHAADTFFQTLEYRLGSGPVLTEAERFADAAYEFALRVDSYADPGVLWDDFQELVDGFDYLAREFQADSYARYQSHVSADFYAIENAMNRLGDAFRDMPRYRQTFSFTYSTWPWYQHRFWAHYHYAPPIRYYQPHIYVSNYYRSGRRFGHIARYRGRHHHHRQVRRYVSPRKYVRQRHFSPNTRNRHVNNNRGQRRDGRRHSNVQRNGSDARIRNNRNGNRQANSNRRVRSDDRNRQDRANRNAQRNDRRADRQVRNGGANNNARRNGQRSWTRNNSAPGAAGTNNRRQRSNNNARPSNSRLAPPRNQDAQRNNRDANRGARPRARDTNARQGRTAPRNRSGSNQARQRSAPRPAASNNNRRQTQTRADSRQARSPNRSRSTSTRQNRSSNNRGTSRSSSTAQRNPPRGGNRRGRADNR